MSQTFDETLIIFTHKTVFYKILIPKFLILEILIFENEERIFYFILE